ncbi:uncharacterized protein LOC135840159 isoform X2 [Planococcus citri]|uniref:uncharacterized protein LOC135840159 isoform X2 n=1 Tax=Planococcus citri TaxID=170843 RepID=UPI0031F8AA56
MLERIMERRRRLEIWNYEPIDLSKKKVVELQQQKMEKRRIECENYEPIDLTERNKKTTESSIDLHVSTISLMEEEMSNIDTEFGLHLSSIFDPSAFDVADQRDPPAPNRVQPDQNQVHQNPFQPDEVEQNSSAADDTVQIVEDTRNAARLIYLQAERDFHHLIYRTLSHEVEAQSKNSSSWPISGSKIIALQNKAKVYIDELKALADNTTYDHNSPAAAMSPNEESRMKDYSRDTFGYRIVSIDESVLDVPADKTTFDDNIPTLIPPNEDSRVKNVSLNTSGNQIVSVDGNSCKALADNTKFGDNIPTTIPSDEESRSENVSFKSSGNQTVSVDENSCKALADNTKFSDNIPTTIPSDEESRLKNVSVDTSSSQIVSVDESMSYEPSYNIPSEYSSFDTSGYQIVPADKNGRYRLPLVTNWSKLSTLGYVQLLKIEQNWRNATMFTKIGNREIYHSDKIPIWDATNPQATKPELLKNYDSHKDDTFKNGFALPFDHVCMFVFACRKNTCRYFHDVLSSVQAHEKANGHTFSYTKRARPQDEKSDEEYDHDKTSEKNQSRDVEEFICLEQSSRPKRRCTEKKLSRFQSEPLVLHGRRSKPQNKPQSYGLCTLF